MAREPLVGDAMFRVLCVHVIASGMWEGRPVSGAIEAAVQSRLLQAPCCRNNLQQTPIKELHSPTVQHGDH